MGKNGLFIAFEGIDGSGKSTQMKLLKERLEALHHRVYCTFEPTDNPIGSLIRSIIKGHEKADNKTIAALFAADRLHHLLNEKNGLLKKLEEGYIVLADRYYFSSYAYQSLSTDMKWIIEINKKAAELLKPDLNIFIDIEVDEAMSRIRNNRTHIDLYESEHLLHTIYANYQKAFNLLRNEEVIVSIQGDKEMAITQEKIWAVVSPLL
ncbi:MAG TPA: dTMP kinase [Chitinophagaceae bacterium]|nr:MAG: thymidylate kinase [Bacteroidetes bacterium OLB11]HMN33070.1 dTMP kinase [Chitinophagaceae bacterium]